VNKSIDIVVEIGEKLNKREELREAGILDPETLTPRHLPEPSVKNLLSDWKSYLEELLNITESRGSLREYFEQTEKSDISLIGISLAPAFAIIDLAVENDSRVKEISDMLEKIRKNLEAREKEKCLVMVGTYDYAYDSIGSALEKEIDAAKNYIKSKTPDDKSKLDMARKRTTELIESRGGIKDKIYASNYLASKHTEYSEEYKNLKEKEKKLKKQIKEESKDEKKEEELKNALQLVQYEKKRVKEVLSLVDKESDKISKELKKEKEREEKNAKEEKAKQGTFQNIAFATGMAGLSIVAASAFAAVAMSSFSIFAIGGIAGLAIAGAAGLAALVHRSQKRKEVQEKKEEKKEDKVEKEAYVSSLKEPAMKFVTSGVIIAVIGGILTYSAFTDLAMMGFGFFGETISSIGGAFLSLGAIMWVFAKVDEILYNRKTNNTGNNEGKGQTKKTTGGDNGENNKEGNQEGNQNNKEGNQEGNKKDNKGSDSKGESPLIISTNETPNQEKGEA
jgi:ABC-type multidrug transport system fused ATPase/permease subunit